MKILQVTNFFKPSFEAGGVARVSYNNSKYLVEHGHEVVVYTTNRSSIDINVETNKPLCVDKMTVYYFENLRKYFSKIPPFPYYSLFVVRKNIMNFDVIHIHEHRTLLAVIVHYYAKKYNIPYVLEPQGSILKLNRKLKSKKMFDALIGNQIIRDAYKLIAGTEMEFEEQQIMGVPSNKITVILPGYDLTLFNNLPLFGQFRTKYQIREKNIILFLGRIDEIKGLDFLIRSFSKLIHSRNDIILVIAGPDSFYKSTLENLVSELNLSSKVLFTGFLDGDDKLSAYVDANIFVQLSRYERFCGSPFEAIMCDTPVITTTNTGCGDFIKKMNFGYTVDYDDISGLNNTIEEILNHSHDAKIKTERCKQYIKSNLKMEKKLDEYIKLYQDAISGVN